MQTKRIRDCDSPINKFLRVYINNEITNTVRVIDLEKMAVNVYQTYADGNYILSDDRVKILEDVKNIKDLNIKVVIDNRKCPADILDDYEFLFYFDFIVKKYPDCKKIKKELNN